MAGNTQSVPKPVERGLREDMNYADRLPPLIRRELVNAPFPVDAQAVYEDWNNARLFGGVSVEEYVRHMRNVFTADLRAHSYSGVERTYTLTRTPRRGTLPISRPPR